MACWGELDQTYDANQTANATRTFVMSNAATVSHYFGLIAVGMKDGSVRSTWPPNNVFPTTTQLYPVGLQ